MVSPLVRRPRRNIDRDFHFRACLGGYRSIVSNRVEAFYRAGAIPSHGFFRSHFDAVLAKHQAQLPGDCISLASAIDAGGGEHDADEQIIIAKRPLSYCRHETRPWWIVAVRSPLRLSRWLLVREFQMRRKRLGNSR
jgi:hypothetical protein